MSQRDFLERGDAQDLENRVQTGLQVQWLFEDRDEHVHGDGDPELGLHGVCGGAVEGLDPKVLLEPSLEERLDLPPALVQLGDRQGRQRAVVGEKHEPPAVLRIGVPNATQPLGVALLAIEAVEPDDLVGIQSGRPIHGLRVQVAVAEVPLGAGDEVPVVLMEAGQPGEVEGGPIDDVRGLGLDHHLIEQVDIVDAARREETHRGDIPRRSKRVWSFLRAAFRFRKVTQGNRTRQRSIIVESKA